MQESNTTVDLESLKVNEARRKQRLVVIGCGVAGLLVAIAVRNFTGTPKADAQVFGSRGRKQRRVRKKRRCRDRSGPSTM
jgi:hypothetical protein